MADNPFGLPKHFHFPEDAGSSQGVRVVSSQSILLTIMTFRMFECWRTDETACRQRYQGGPKEMYIKQFGKGRGSHKSSCSENGTPMRASTVMLRTDRAESSMMTRWPCRSGTRHQEETHNPVCWVSLEAYTDSFHAWQKHRDLSPDTSCTTVYISI